MSEADSSAIALLFYETVRSVNLSDYSDEQVRVKRSPGRPDLLKKVISNEPQGGFERHVTAALYIAAHDVKTNECGRMNGDKNCS
jgi:hypothetical protein